MHRLFWPVFFVLFAPLPIFTSFFILLNIFSPQVANTNSPQVLAETTSNQDPSISYSYTTADARPLILSEYLNKYNSDLARHADDIVKMADEHSIDYRLVVAIARQESNLCKRIPKNSFNCWGYGIYGDKVVYFPSYLVGIEKVTQLLAKYKKSGLKTPEEIMTKYTPPSANSDGAWAKGVTSFLSELE